MVVTSPYKMSVLTCKPLPAGIFLWEPSLLAMAVGQFALILTDTPPSRAGSLPQLISIERLLCVQRRSPCGSEPARDRGGTSNIDGTGSYRTLQRLLPDQPTVFIKTRSFCD